MPLNSVNTNVGAMIALQSLNAINRELLTTQIRISTGKRINSPKDNGAIWAIAQNQRSESRALDAVQASLQRGQSAVDVAMSAGESISDMLNLMRETMLAVSDPSQTPQSKAALNEQYLSYRRQIDTITRQAEFGGLNLIGSGSQAVRALANAAGTDTIDVGHVDLSTTGAALSGLPADLTGTIGDAQIQAMSTAIGAVNSAIATLGSGAKRLDRHLSFISRLQDTIDAGVGNLVDADLARESARLQAGDPPKLKTLNVGVDLTGELAGYRARRHAGVIDLDKVGLCDPRDFWEPLQSRRGELLLDPGEFYILASKETVEIPVLEAAEMMPIDPAVGEFRVHYAGFFDPGFGVDEAHGAGSRGVLEVRSHTPFLLEDGQTVARLVYEPLTQRPARLYGEGGSHYQKQGLKLSKHFGGWG